MRMMPCAVSLTALVIRPEADDLAYRLLDLLFVVDIGSFGNAWSVEVYDMPRTSRLFRASQGIQYSASYPAERSGGCQSTYYSAE